MTIPPWLHSPDFVGAMQSGAQTGLAVRRQSDEEDQSADRLGLAYNQLAQNERELAQNERLQNQSIKAKLDLEHASMALRSQQLDATRAYHQGTLDAREAARQLREDNMQRMGDQFQQREGRLGNQFGERQDAAALREQRLGDQFRERMDRLENLPGRLEPEQQALLNADVSELRGTRNELNKIDKQGGPSWGLFGGNKAQYANLKKKEADLLDKIKTYKPKKSGAATATPTATHTYVPGKGIVPISQE